MNGPQPQPENKPITIIDVAKLAGVSIKTVSRVMNREKGVGQETRERVEKIIQDLAYVPNVSARALSSHRNYLIGFPINKEIVHEYFMLIQLGAADACFRQGYHLATESGPESDADFDRYFQQNFARTTYDGVILTPPLSDNPLFVERLQKRGVGVVRITPARDFDLTPYVSTNDEEAGYQMTSAICDAGHRLIALIEGPPDHQSSEFRKRGYIRALRDHGLEPSQVLLESGDYTSISGFEAAERLLAQSPRPTAIFALNDSMALGALAACNKHGLRAPEDISVVGFDDIPAASTCWPPLTTVSQPIRRMGEAATELLIGQIGDPGHRGKDWSIFLPCEIVRRGSLGPPPTRP